MICNKSLSLLDLKKTIDCLRKLTVELDKSIMQGEYPQLPISINERELLDYVINFGKFLQKKGIIPSIRDPQSRHEWLHYAQASIWLKNLIESLDDPREEMILKVPKVKLDEWEKLKVFTNLADFCVITRENVLNQIMTWVKRFNLPAMRARKARRAGVHGSRVLNLVYLMRSGLVGRWTEIF